MQTSGWFIYPTSPQGGDDMAEPTPVSRKQFESIKRIARVNPGCKIDTQHSTTAAILVVNRRGDKRWVVNNKGKIRRVVTVTT